MSTAPDTGGVPVDGVPALLRRFVDDAALVGDGPRREMAEVLDVHYAARGGALGGALGALVVPVSRLQELVGELARRRPASALPIALAVDTGLGGVPKALSLTSSRAALVSLVSVEMPAPHDVDSIWLERVTEFVPDEVVAVVEPRRPDADGSVDWLDGVGRVIRHGCRPKLRCGGGRAGAFPGIGDVVSFLRAAIGSGRSFTASIGLQHAVRRTDPDSGFTHHGWLNLLAATRRALGADATDAGWATVQEPVREALASTDTAALVDELVALDEAEAARLRALFSSFGSSSPGGPGAEMVRLGMIPGGP